MRGHLIADRSGQWTYHQGIIALACAIQHKLDLSLEENKHTSSEKCMGLQYGSETKDGRWADEACGERR